MRIALLFCSLLITPLPLFAQSSPATEPLKLKDGETKVWEHRTGPEVNIHRSQQEMEDLKSIKLPRFVSADGTGSCSFNLVVSATGAVESATPVHDASFEGPCSPHEQEAETILRARQYKPWLVDGRAVRVQIVDWVSLYPPERLGPHLDFPEKIDPSTLSFTLQRTGCLGSCAGYSVTIKGDGTVLFDGEDLVKITGRHTARIGKTKVQELLDAFRRADFLSALPNYYSNWTDHPTYTLTVTFNGQTKKVVDYDGLKAGLPSAIRELENTIDIAADTARWVRGNGDVLRVLQDEHWDFSAKSKDNLRLFRQAILNADEPLIQAFLKAHVPVLSTFGQSPSPIYTASWKGRLDLVQQMLGEETNLPAGLANRALVFAALSGDLAMLHYWLDRGADPKAQIVPDSHDDFDEDTGVWIVEKGILAAAIASGSPEMLRSVLSFHLDVNQKIDNQTPPIWAIERSRTREAVQIIQLLLAAGSDPNGRDWTGKTALFYGFSQPKLIELFLANGADINAHDKSGDTPLIRSAFMEDTVRILLEHGADPIIKNLKGETALDLAKRYSCAECVALIQSAIDKRNREKDTAGSTAP